MSSHNLSHQGKGTLRGSVMLPLETASDNEAGYKTAVSDVDSDGSTNGKASRAKSTNGESDSQRKERPEDTIEVEELSDDDDSEHVSKPGPRETPKKTPKDSPAYVAPIGKIPDIPPVEPISPASQQHSPPPAYKDEKPKKPPVHQIPKEHLVGKTINDFGDIVDDNDIVLGRVEGDLPSMVGRKVANARGDVFGDNGELLGYVAEVETAQGERQDEPKKEEAVPTWSLTEAMKAMAAAGNGPGGLRVDPYGNILDPQGNIVGSFHDNISGFGKKNAPSGEYYPNSHNGGAAGPSDRQRRPDPKRTRQESAAADEAEPSSKPERRENAQSHRKEDPKESPSDIFLDVKSTTEGIQLTIRIPTVFNSGGQPAQPPKIVFQ